jgi:hypothetical protein
MTAMLTTNIILAAAIFAAVVGPLTWAIRTQARDTVAPPSIPEAAPAETSRPTARRLRPRTATRTLSSPHETAPS